MMYELIFYETASGESPFGLFLEELDRKSATDKTARTQLKQLMFHLDLLTESGTRIGTRYAKHLDGSIWELTPGDNRVLFSCGPVAVSFCSIISGKPPRKHPRRK